MTYSNIRIADNTKKILDEIKDQYFFTTYESCVNSLADFIVRNSINPRNDLGDFKSSMNDLEMRISKNIATAQKQLNADNVSLRKWVGAIERDYLLPIKKNINVVDKLVNSNIFDKTSEKIEREKFENPLNANLPKVNAGNNNEEIQGLYQQILDSNSKIDECEMKLDKQNKILNKIFNAAKTEQGGMLSKEKIIIEMNIEDWEKLKEF